MQLSVSVVRPCDNLFIFLFVMLFTTRSDGGRSRAILFFSRGKHYTFIYLESPEARNRDDGRKTRALDDSTKHGGSDRSKLETKIGDRRQIFYNKPRYRYPLWPPNESKLAPYYGADKSFIFHVPSKDPETENRRFSPTTELFWVYRFICVGVNPKASQSLLVNPTPTAKFTMALPSKERVAFGTVEPASYVSAVTLFSKRKFARTLPRLMHFIFD